MYKFNLTEYRKEAFKNAYRQVEKMHTSKQKRCIQASRKSIRECRKGADMFNKLTASDIEKMKQEIEYRKLTVRKEAIEAVKEARAHGDLSENFEYYAAKKDKNKNESRIRYLERMIKTAEVVEDHSAQDEVGINNQISIYFEDDAETEEYKLITTVRENSLQGLISIESPLGKAILGHKVNDRVYVKVREDYGYYVVIKAINKTTEDSNDRIRSY